MPRPSFIPQCNQWTLAADPTTLSFSCLIRFVTGGEEGGGGLAGFNISEISLMFGGRKYGEAENTKNNEMRISDYFTFYFPWINRMF